MASGVDRFWVVWRYGGPGPLVKHPSQAGAEGEAKRLAAKHPGCQFFVLESVAGWEIETPEPTAIVLNWRPSDVHIRRYVDSSSVVDD